MLQLETLSLLAICICVCPLLPSLPTRTRSSRTEPRGEMVPAAFTTRCHGTKLGFGRVFPLASVTVGLARADGSIFIA